MFPTSLMPLPLAAAYAAPARSPMSLWTSRSIHSSSSHWVISSCRPQSEIMVMVMVMVLMLMMMTTTMMTMMTMMMIMVICV